MALSHAFRAMLTAGRAAPASCISLEFVSTAVSRISFLAQKGEAVSKGFLAQWASLSKAELDKLLKVLPDAVTLP